MSERMYGEGYPGIMFWHVDPRDDRPEIKTLTKSLPQFMRVPIYDRQARYRCDVMMGDAHPLETEIKEANYELITVATVAADISMDSSQRSYDNLYKFNQDEIEFIQSITKDPKVEWAIENSFDGLYIHKQHNHADFRTQYRFAVYLKAEQATFWKLKYHGR